MFWKKYRSRNFFRFSLHLIGASQPYEFIPDAGRVKLRVMEKKYWNEKMPILKDRCPYYIFQKTQYPIQWKFLPLFLRAEVKHHGFSNCIMFLIAALHYLQWNGKSQTKPNIQSKISLPINVNFNSNIYCYVVILLFENDSLQITIVCLLWLKSFVNKYCT